MKIRWKKVFYFVFLLGSMFGFKNAVGQNDSIQKSQNQQIQTSFSITGHVFAGDSITPIPYCHIYLEDLNNNQIAITVCDFDGFFKINNIPNGAYYLSFRLLNAYNPSPIIKKINIQENSDYKLFFPPILLNIINAEEIIDRK